MAELRDDPDLVGASAIMISPLVRVDAQGIRRDLGADAVLVKPVFGDTLREVVTCMLGVAVRAGDGAGRRAQLTAFSSHGIKILLVEDNRINQKVATRMLERRGYSVTAAGNGRLALERLEREDYDVVLMDVQMPEMGGEEATRRIRARERGTGRHVPIIAMTARAMKGDRDRCLAVGMDDYVSKPVRPEILMSAIESAVGLPLQNDDASGALNESAEIDPDVFDVAGALDRLDDDSDLLDELVAIFLEDWPERHEELASAIRRTDLESAMEIVHGLKGAAASLGATAASSMAAEVEEAARATSAPAVDRAFVDLERAMERLVDTLRAFLARPPVDERDALECPIP